MKSKFKLLLLGSLWLISALPAYSQSIGLGTDIHYNSNGINIFYTNEIRSGKWNYDVGLIITPNGFSLKGNEKNRFLYQTGYANSFWEHFSFNFRAGRKLVSCPFFQLDAIANLYLSYQSTVRPFNIYQMGSNTLISSGHRISKRGVGVELTVGLKGIIHLSKRTDLIFASGWGLYHDEHKWSDEAFENINAAKMRNSKYAIVGIDGLPMMSLAVAYKLGDRLSKANVQ